MLEILENPTVPLGPRRDVGLDVGAGAKGGRHTF